MSVYYFNGAQILAPLTITSNEPLYEVDTVSLRKQRASQGVQRWELAFNTVGTAETQVDIFLGAVVDNQEVQSMVMPQLPQVDAKTTLSQPTLNMFGTTVAGATTTLLVGTSAYGFIPKGTFFKFSNHDKIYVTTNDVQMGSTNKFMNFYPALRVQNTNSNTVRFGSGAILTYYRDINNQTGITFSDGVLSNAGTISVIEAL
jgi:hypothetical protein